MQRIFFTVKKRFRIAQYNFLLSLSFESLFQIFSYFFFLEYSIASRTRSWIWENAWSVSWLFGFRCFLFFSLGLHFLICLYSRMALSSTNTVLFGIKSLIILRTVLVSTDTCSFGLQFKKAFWQLKFSKDLLINSVSVYW